MPHSLNKLFLHPSQENVWFDQLIYPDSPKYNIGGYAPLEFEVDHALLEKAWLSVITRHDALRMDIQADEDGLLKQQLLPSKEIDSSVEFKDFSGMENPENSSQLWMSMQFERTFDIANKERYQIALLKLSANRYYMFLRMHHLFVDGISITLLSMRTLQHYENLRRGMSIDNTYPAYCDAIDVAREYLDSSRYTRNKEYWQAFLSDHEITRLRRFYPEQSGGDHFTIDLDDLQSRNLRAYCQSQKSSLMTALLAVSTLYFSQTLNLDDLVVSVPVHGRRGKRGMQTIGMHSNICLLATTMASSDSFTELLQHAELSLKSGLKRGQFPQSHLSRLMKDNSGGADISLNYELNNFWDCDINTRGMYLSTVSETEGLSIRLIDYGESESLHFRFTSKSAFYSPVELEQLSTRFTTLLMQCIKQPDNALSSFDLLSESDRHTLLHTWNETDAPYPQDRTLAQLFEAQVEKTPDNVALVFEEEALTYRELNQRANQLARLIRERFKQRQGHALSPDTLIALYLERSLEMVISILAVLKAGAAYVPISPDYPKERTQFMLEDTQSALLLTQSQHLTLLDSWTQALSQQPPTLIATDMHDTTACHEATNLETLNSTNDLAYVIYTSGTTGKPKGVMVSHTNIVNNIDSQIKLYGYRSDEVTLFYRTYCFDGSIEEYLTPLLCGSQVIIMKEDYIFDVDLFKSLIIHENVTKINASPSFLLGLLDNIQDIYDVSSLRLIISEGERLPEELAIKITSIGYELVNSYGPTETTSDTLRFIFTPGIPIKKSIIGRPIHNTQAFVLDNALLLTPIGTPGELYIGGAGLARGYLNRPDLTAERFIDNPFATYSDIEKGYTRLYKTGDLVRWLPDGNLEYLGRNDFQVKIRGYRIELGEIESALVALEGIKQAVVIDRERAGSKYLAAYVVSDEAINPDALILSLSQALPEYMVPSAFVQLAEVPLTINGKLNRRALPEPDLMDADNYVAPRNELEAKLCAVWQEVLGLESVGIHDNFFRIGGDSIVSIQLISRLRKAGLSLQVKDIFDAPTIAQLTECVSGATAVVIDAEQGVLTGAFDLLPIQQWFFDKALIEPNHFNQAFVQRIPDDISSEAVELMLNELSAQHCMLRVHYAQTDVGWQQTYGEQSRMAPLVTLDVSGMAEATLSEKLTAYQASLEIESGPTWQVVHLLGCSDGYARLVFIAHHLIIDAVSWRILAEDMQSLLTGQSLPAKTSSYRQWVNTVAQYAAQNEAQVPYWHQVGDGAMCYPQPQAASSHTLEWDASLTTRLLREAPKGYHTEINDLLLSALAMALSETFGSDRTQITLEGHGRESIAQTIDTSRTVGWFTTTYLVALERMQSPESTLIQTKEMLRAVPDKGIGFGALSQAGRLNQPLPPVSFNYLGQFDTNHENGLWQLTGESTGESVSLANNDALLLNINGAVQHGRLSFHIASQLSEASTALFLTAFESAVKRITDIACAKASKGGLHTPSDYPAADLSLARLQSIQSRYSDIEAIYPASSLQQGFIVHDLAHPEDDAYRVQLLLDYHQSLNVELYQRAWQLASERYPALRMAFDVEGEPLQIITRGNALTAAHFSVLDLSHLDEAARETRLVEIQQADRQVGFDLTCPGLLRLQIIKQADNHYTVIKTEHHGVSDGWSGPVLWQFIHETYQQLCDGKSPTVLLETTYLSAQAYSLKHQAVSQQYWSEQKAQWEGTTDIQYMLSYPQRLHEKRVVNELSEVSLTLTGVDLTALKQQCQVQGVTLNVAVQFAWHKLLQIYSGSEQTLVGTTVSGRDMPIEGIEQSVGLYINTLPLCVQWDKSAPCADVLQRIHQQIAALNSHSNVSLAGLQSNGERLFQSLLVFENYPAPTDDNNHDTTVRGAIEKTDYPLSLTAYEHQGCLSVKLSYDAALLTETQATRLMSQMEQVLKVISHTPEQLHETINLLSDDERHTLLHAWNETDAPYPQDKTLAQLFEGQVEKTPDSVALVFEGESLTYRELNHRANQLARLIRERYQQHQGHALTPDTLVALYLDRSLEMVVSILATLKAGGAYVPISPEYPKERTQFILEDTQTALLLTQSQHIAQLDAWTHELSQQPPTMIATDMHEMIECYEVVNLELVSGPDDLAYVIYTSGTTGKPKGVMVEHHNIHNSVKAQIERFSARNYQSILQFFPYVFDVSVAELFIGLLLGQTIFICTDNERKNPRKLTQLIHKHQIQMIMITPSFASCIDSQDIGSIQSLIVGGESASPELIFKLSQERLLFNAYGPTESTVCVTANLFSHGDLIANIGKAIGNVQLYILNDHMRLVPIGTPGELYIGGAGLVRGYLNRPDLTAERFIDNPFATDSDIEKGYTRLYKTGDLVRWLPDGNLEYLGRNDFQVKIRGYRIELGEIESALSALPQVKQAVVIDRERAGSKYLAAYVVSDEAINPDALTLSLSQVLPEYMVPSAFVQIDDVPLTINGKLDRRALPEPDLMDRDNYAAPRNEQEAQLCVVWQDVLGLESVGIHDNFFRIGGDSITAIRLTAASRKAMGMDIPLALLFECKTIARLASQLVHQELTVIPSYQQTQYPLSFAQERLWFIEQLEQGSSAYHIPSLVKLKADTQWPALQEALSYLVKRHSVLSSTYQTDEQERGYQVLLDEPLAVESLSVPVDSDWLTLVRDEVSRPFNLSDEIPLRVRHYEVGTEQYVLLLWHHIAFDGWSTDVFLRELTLSYNALIQQKAIVLPELEISYGDYAQWQRNYLQGPRLASELKYWTETLSGYETLALTTDHPRPKTVDYRGENHDFTLDAQLSERLRELARNQETTLYTVLLSAFYVTLSALSGQDDILLGTPSENRHHPQTQELVGFFVNSLVLRALINSDVSVQEAINQVHRVVTGAKEHQELPFEKLVDALDVERDLARHPIFQVMFSLENFGGSTPEGLPFTPVSVTETSADYSVAKFDISLSLSDQSGEISGQFNYAVSLFEAESIERMSSIYHRVLRAFADNTRQTVGQIDVLSQSERQTLLYTWNETDAPYPQDKTLAQLFEAQVEKTPDNIALVFEEETLTYRELNHRANQLARLIRERYQQHQGHALTPDTLVALYLDRSLEMVVSILATLKAGGAYVPISPEYPKERTQFILEDTQTALLLTQHRHLDRLNGWISRFDSQPALLAVDDAACFASRSTDDIELTSAPVDLAYVIYTSGTTGFPKGVMVTHSSVVNNVISQLKFFGYNSSDTFLFYRSYCFDGSIEEYLLPLLGGVKVVIMPNLELFDGELFKRLIIEYGVTKINMSPTLLQAMLAGMQAIHNRSLLRLVISGGERISGILAKDIIGMGYKLVNSYGPTETTVDISRCVFNSRPNTDRSIIGLPILNSRAYILDRSLRLSPIGKPGELYIGGAGLARGYLNRPDLTAERFIDNPFATASDIEKGYTRLYKTGDLVRWLPDGNLEYLGRNDFQVKIRGYRIELGEIESALVALEGIKQAVVIDRERAGSKYLAAYIVSDEAINPDALILSLSQVLPEYMVPSALVQLAEVPLTINGKLDRRALPEPDLMDADNYAAPRNEQEAQLCAVWQDVLGLESVGIHDNFFRIGGDSITAIRLTAASRKAMGMDIPLALLFECKTIARLATQLVHQELTVIPSYQQTQYPLSFAQERLWFIEQLEQGSSAYHIPSLVKLNSDTQWPALQEALSYLVKRHSVLSSTCQTDEQERGYQVLLDEPLTVESLRVSAGSDWLTLVRDEVSRPFNLSDEIPLRVIHYEVGTEQYVLLLWHHIAFDGWSTDVFLRELTLSYNALIQQKAIVLPELEISYGDYAQWQRDYLQGPRLASELQYWTKTLSGYETLALTTDHSRPQSVDYSGRNHDFTLDGQLSEQLRELARNQETTLYTVLLSAFYVTLSALSGQDDILVGTPSENRHHPQTQDLVGFFVNSLVLRALINSDVSVQETINQVHRVVTGAKEHQELPFEKLVDALDVERDLTRHPLFQVMFSLQKFGESTAEGLPFTPVSVTETSADYSVAKFDICLFLNDQDDEIKGQFNYALSLFEAESIERMSAIYQRVLRAFAQNTQQSIGQIDMLSQSERHILLHTWNETEVSYPQDKTLAQLFEEQVEKTPDNIALVFEEETLTYRELNHRANQLARLIRKRFQERQSHALTPDTLIALYLDRSLEMVVSILAVLKAGGAYVPISPEYPKERTQFLLEDTQTALLLTQSQHLAQLDAWAHELSQQPPVLIATDMPEATECYETNNLEPISGPGDLAYVIYTSGTTGKPKGVMIEHQNVNHLAQAQIKKFKAKDYRLALLFASYVFDASVFELFISLFAGHTLYVCADNERQSAEKLIQLIGKYQIQLATLPPVLLASIEVHELDSVQSLIVAGESPSAEMMCRFSQGRYLFNAYGPTESTVCATANLFSQGDLATNIGKAISNVQLYVLDNHMRLVPIGTPGELFIGGAGLARGYLNRPDLTAERFINNPFATDSDIEKGYTRLYKTGDLVRWLPDGNLEYLGRNDFQIKIRGYRIELGEIESALSALPQVKQAVVIDRERAGSKYLAAYIVSDEVINPDALTLSLSQVLPKYMVPSAFAQIDEVPLTINGKLDRRALPEPDLMDADNYVAPRNDIEVQLCAVWQDVLGLKSVGIHDNFFRIGGDSITAIRLTAASCKAIDINIPLAQLFANPTISCLSNSIKAGSDINLMVHLTPDTSANTKIFMIHPGIAGAEVYQGLANSIKDKVNCFGINHYNLINDDPILELNKLSKLYCKEILSEVQPGETINLLGWSLGGTISLEVAVELESLGWKDINIILLDSGINFETVNRSLLTREDIENIIKLAGIHIDLSNSDYVEQVIKCATMDTDLMACHISSDLDLSRVYLIQAGINSDLGSKKSEEDLLNHSNSIARISKGGFESIIAEQHHHYDIIKSDDVMEMMRKAFDF